MGNFRGNNPAISILNWDQLYREEFDPLSVDPFGFAHPEEQLALKLFPFVKMVLNHLKWKTAKHQGPVVQSTVSLNGEQVNKFFKRSTR